MDTLKIIKILENIDLMLEKMTPIMIKLTSGSLLVGIGIAWLYIIYFAIKSLANFIKK